VTEVSSVHQGDISLCPGSLHNNHRRKKTLEKAAVVRARDSVRSDLQSKKKRGRKSFRQSLVLLAIEDKETNLWTVSIVVGAKFRATLL
jgi:hypothetical protein